jgi:hypothetical protein
MVDHKQLAVRFNVSIPSQGNRVGQNSVPVLSQGFHQLSRRVRQCIHGDVQRRFITDMNDVNRCRLLSSEIERGA